MSQQLNMPHFAFVWCVTNQSLDMTLNAEKKMVVQRTPLDRAYRLGCVDSVCKSPKGAIVKSCGAERSGKDAVQTVSVTCK